VLKRCENSEWYAAKITPKITHATRYEEEIVAAYTYAAQTTQKYK